MNDKGQLGHQTLGLISWKRNNNDKTQIFHVSPQWIQAKRGNKAQCVNSPRSHIPITTSLCIGLHSTNVLMINTTLTIKEFCARANWAAIRGLQEADFKVWCGGQIWWGEKISWWSYLYVPVHSLPPQGSRVALPRRSSYGSCRALLGNAHAHKHKAAKCTHTHTKEHPQRGIKYIKNMPFLWSHSSNITADRGEWGEGG